MAATLMTCFPEKAPELFAYQASIVRAERNYEPGRWVSYDRQFRLEALARKNLNWSITDPRLYSEAFTGRARIIPQCQFRLQDDQIGQYFPRNRGGSHSMVSCPQARTATPGRSRSPIHTVNPTPQPAQRWPHHRC